MTARTPVAERLLRRRRIDENGCWLWQGTTTWNGYGTITYPEWQTRSALVHRVAFTIWISEIPDGLHIDHLCSTRNCFNPAHLEPVTQAENNRRAFARRSGPRYCKRGHDLDTTQISNYRCGVCHAARLRATRAGISVEEALQPQVRPERRCPRGHLVVGENLYSFTRRDGRVSTTCRICRNESARRIRARAKMSVTT